MKQPVMEATQQGLIAGLQPEECAELLNTIRNHGTVERVVLYGSRALERQRSGSDVDLCLDAPGMSLGELLELGGELDDLLLPWRIDLQLRHMIDHPGLLAHLERAGIVIWERQQA